MIDYLGGCGKVYGTGMLSVGGEEFVTMTNPSFAKFGYLI